MLKGLFNFLKGSSLSGTHNEINLLLLGETGVGKSTFINSFGNYFKYPTFKAAQKGQLKILIPIKVGKKLHGNEDTNECHTSGAAQTQYVKVYMIPVNIGGTQLKLRLIDTPGVGDPRGIDKDNENCDNILAYLATLKRLHGICFIMKANNTRFTQFFEYCFKQILTRLDKSASENIIFITTYSTTSGYTAGETKTSCLENLVDRIRSIPPHVEIPLKDDNTFALDNGAFKPLLQMKDGKTFSNHEKSTFGMSWNTSAKECFRLLTYIIGDERRPPLKPHDVENTTSINEVRFLIEQLANPLAEITDLIQDNIRVLDRHKLNLQKENQDVNQLKQQLYIPCVDLQVKELDQPVTVCTNAEKCAEVVRINNITKWHYQQRCHNPCYLTGIPKEVIGDPGLADCAAMTGENCHECGCHYKVHVHIYKETEKLDVQKEDKNVKKEIKTKEDAIACTDQLIKTYDIRKRELEQEAEFISEKMAIFSYFLQENAITPYNDAYKEYIEYLIKNERSLGRMADQTRIEKYNKLLQKHEHLQATFKKSQQTHSQSLNLALMLNPSNIKTYINELYNLKHMGEKIQELIHKSSACRDKEIQKNFNCVMADPVNLNSDEVDDNCSVMSFVNDVDVPQPKALEDSKDKQPITSDVIPKEDVKQNKPDDFDDKNRYFLDILKLFFETTGFQLFTEGRFPHREPRRTDKFDDYYYENWSGPGPRRFRRPLELEGRSAGPYSRSNRYRGRDEFYNDRFENDEFDDYYHGRKDEQDDNWSLRSERRRQGQESSKKSTPRSKREDKYDSDHSLELDGRQDEYDDNWSVSRESARVSKSQPRRQGQESSKKPKPRSKREDKYDSDHSLELDGRQDEYDDNWSVSRESARVSKSQPRRQGQESSKKPKPRSKREDKYDSDHSLELDGRQDEYDDNWSVSRESARVSKSQPRRQGQESSKKPKPRSKREDKYDSDHSLELDGRQDEYDDNWSVSRESARVSKSQPRRQGQESSKKPKPRSKREDKYESDHSLELDGGQDEYGDNWSLSRESSRVSKSQHRRPHKFDELYHDSRRRNSYSKKTNRHSTKQDKYDSYYASASKSYKSGRRDEFADDRSVSGHSSSTLRRRGRRDDCVCRCSSHTRHHGYADDRSSSEDLTPERRKDKYESRSSSSSSTLDDLENLSSTETKEQAKLNTKSSDKQANVKEVRSGRNKLNNLGLGSSTGVKKREKVKETPSEKLVTKGRDSVYVETDCGKEQEKIAPLSDDKEVAQVTDTDVSPSTSRLVKMSGNYGFESLLSTGSSLSSLKRANSAPSLDFEFLTPPSNEENDE